MNPITKFARGHFSPTTPAAAKPVETKSRLSLTPLEDRLAPAFVGLDMYQFGRTAAKSAAATAAVVRTVEAPVTAATPIQMSFTFENLTPAPAKSAAVAARPAPTAEIAVADPTSVSSTPGRSAPPRATQPVAPATPAASTAPPEKKVEATPAPAPNKVTQPTPAAPKPAASTPATPAASSATQSPHASLRAGHTRPLTT